MALCLYNNVAVAARAAQRRGVGRVLILDWDVHHGNGIQRVFYDDPDVLYVSIHQDGLFPAASGLVMETGTGAGKGSTLNVPLPPGTGHDAYLAVVGRVVEPAARAFGPDLILVAAGVDASGHDPMGRMMCTSRTFHAMTSAMCRLADELTGAGSSSSTRAATRPGTSRCSSWARRARSPACPPRRTRSCTPWTICRASVCNATRAG